MNRSAKGTRADKRCRVVVVQSAADRLRLRVTSDIISFAPAFLGWAEDPLPFEALKMAHYSTHVLKAA